MSRIEWTDKTWNPVIGCAKVSAGCKNCYAERSAYRVAALQGGGVYLQVLRTGTDERGNIEHVHPRWNGRAVFLPERLGEPLRWRKPRRVFVNSMSDLFHEDISFEQIAAVFGVMAAAQRHTFQVLTKRPARMLEFFRWMEALAERQRHQVFMNDTVAWVRRQILHSAAQREGVDPYKGGQRSGAMGDDWPLPNVHIGASVEDQAAADERIPLLLQCPAALRFLSVEPLLGPVDLDPTICPHCGGRKWESEQVEEAFPEAVWTQPTCIECDAEVGSPGWLDGIGWVIVGGESGRGARPCDLGWIRSVVQQCRAAGVPVFVKQLGSHPTAASAEAIGDSMFAAIEASDMETAVMLRDGSLCRLRLDDRKGADPSEWPEDLRVQEFPEVRHG